MFSFKLSCIQSVMFSILKISYYNIKKIVWEKKFKKEKLIITFDGQLMHLWVCFVFKKLKCSLAQRKIRKVHLSKTDYY